MMSYESAGLWQDELGEVCLVVKPEFEDGQNDMLLLYKGNEVASVKHIKQGCQWCALPDAPKKVAKSRKRKVK